MNFFLFMELIQETVQQLQPKETLQVDFKINQVNKVTGEGRSIIREGVQYLDKRKILQQEKDKWILINPDETEQIIYSTREKLIENEIDKYTILPEFRDWALQVLKENHKKEVSDRNKILKNRQKLYSETQRQIDRLIDMRLR